MKTIEEAAAECTEDLMYIGFIKGVEFAQRWIPVGEEIPTELDYENNTNYVLAKTSTGNIQVAWRQSQYNEWWTNYNKLQNITHWRPINIL
jgi:hypothetical protein